MILDHMEKSSSRLRAGKKIFGKNVGKLTKMVKKSEDERGRIKIHPRASPVPVSEMLAQSRDAVSFPVYWQG